MAADETDPLYDPARRKRSKSGRTPPVIEGEAAAPAPEPEPVVEAQAAEPAPPPPEPALASAPALLLPAAA